MYVVTKLDIPVVASFNYHRYVPGGPHDPGQRESVEIYDIGLVGPRGTIIELSPQVVAEIIRLHSHEMEDLAREQLAEIAEVLR